MITEVKGNCQYEGCNQPATTLVSGRRYNYSDSEAGHPEPALYCEAHTGKVSCENAPEYEVVCPNCGCQFGVN